MRARIALGAAASLALFTSACGGAEPMTPDPAGRVAIAVAPLDLPGITDVCYTLTATNGLGDVVWTRSNVCADQYGDGVGGISYVGTCDAGPGAATHEISLAIDSISDASGPLSASAWQDPGVLTRPATCVADTDTPVDFAITVMRNATQGFFDVAVQFEDLFCSAKVDCVDGGGAPLRLLHDASGGRGRTIVAALACTQGKTGPGTLLYRSPLTLDCPDPFVDVALDPSLGPGNVYASAASNAPVFQYAVYEGREQLTSGGDPIDKVYWNLAIGVDPTQLPDGCRLTGTAAAGSGAFTDAHTPAGNAYPYINIDVPLTSGGALTCTSHPLNGADVTTRYTPLDTPVTFAYAFDGVSAAPTAQSIGRSALNPGLTCEAILNADPTRPDDVYWIDPSGGDPADAFQAYCDMTTDDGGWTLLITYQTSATPYATVADWPDTFATTSAAPNATGMYKGSLDAFSEVREEVNSGANVVWARNLTPAELEQIRQFYGYTSRMTAAPSYADIPSCRTSYAGATDDVVHCAPDTYTGTNDDTIIGFQSDVFGTAYCFFARGGGSWTSYQGSARCFSGGDADGTRWARTWFR